MNRPNLIIVTYIIAALSIASITTLSAVANIIAQANTTDTNTTTNAAATDNTTTNNASNALLGRFFSYDEGKNVESNVNIVNKTHIVVSYSGNRMILPPNATGVINTTETGNVTINIQPNRLSFNQGHAIIMTEGGAAAEGKEDSENATFSFVLLTRTSPDGSGNGTSITYFSTNSTGQLAFLDDLVAIGQVEYSEDGINRFAEWEWKGGTIPFENLLPHS